MDVRALRSFYQVARIRSFSKAATALRVSQSTVSNHVSRLEKELGGPLFDRDTRPIRITPFGVRLLESVGPFLGDLDALRESVDRSRDNPIVQVAATDVMVEHFLTKAITHYRATHSRVRIRIEVGQVAQVLDRVEHGEADLSFAAVYEARPTLVFQKLFKWDRVLITALGHPLLEKPLYSLQQLCPWPLILQPEGGVARMLLESEFHRKGLQFQVAMEIRSYQSYHTIKRYVGLGVGLAIVPAPLIDPADQQSLGVVNLRDILPGGVAGMYHRPTRSLNPLVQEFAKTALSTLRHVGETVTLEPPTSVA